MKKSFQIISGLMLLAVLASCSEAPDTDNPIDSGNSVLRLSLMATPETVRADGVSKMVLFTELFLGDAPVSDSTQIILLNTKGTLQSGVLYTHSGVALDTLTADTIAGIGWIYAYSSGLRDSVEIMMTDE